MKKAKMTVESVGMISSLGCTRSQILQALKDRPEPVNETYRSVDQSLKWQHVRAHDEHLKSILKPYGGLRRANHFTKLAMASVAGCVKAASFIEESPGLIVCTSYGPMNTAFSFLDAMLFEGEDYVSPIAFANSLPNCAAGTITNLLGWSSPTLSIVTHNAPFFQGMLVAQQWLDTSVVKQVILVMVEEYCPVIAPGMAAMNPSDSQLFIGEGAVAWLLTDHGVGSGLVLEETVPEMPPQTIDFTSFIGKSPCSDILTLTIAAMLEHEIKTYCRPFKNNDFSVCIEENDPLILHLSDQRQDYHLRFYEPHACAKLI